MSKKFFLFSCVLFCLHLTILAQIPSQNLQLWLRADSGVVLNNGAVESWLDVSGNNNHASQVNTIQQPLYVNNAIHGKSALGFNGINRYLNGTTIPDINTSSLTLFVVANGANYIGTEVSPFWGINFYPNQFIFGRSSITKALIASNTSFYSSALTSSANSLPNEGFSYSIFSYSKQINTLSRIFINNFLINSTTASSQTGPFVNGNYYIGFGNVSNYLAFYNGNIAEIIVYDTLLSENDRISIEHYLMNKYAPAIDLGSDIIQNYRFCPVKLGVSPDYTSAIWSTGSTADTIIVSQTGYYSVQVTDIFNRISRDTVYVEFPVLSFPDTVICLGDTVEYATMLPGPYFYEWSDLSTDSLLRISQAGTYWLKVTDTLGCFKTDTFSVSVDTFASQVSLGADTSLCAGNTIQLLSGQSQATTYQWFPGNETTSSIQIDTSGWVGVHVQNANGCIALDSLFVTIVGTAPVPDFEYEHVCFGENTVFTDLSDPQGSIAQRMWIFNNTDTLYGQTVQYIFPDPGTHNVKLFVEDTAGCASQKTEQIVIFPVPAIHIEHNPVCTGTPVLFQGIVTIPPGTTINGQQWLVNGMPFGSNSTLWWTFLSEDMYEIQFTVLLDNGCSATETISVQVSDSYPQPGAFQIYSPANNAVIGDTTLQISWNTSPGALFYKLFIATDPQFLNVITEVDSVLVNSLSISVPGNGEYYCKIRACNPCAECTDADIIHFVVFSPASLSNLKLWLRADSGVVNNTGNVISWNDLSGNGNNAVQNLSNSQPQFIPNVLNGYPVVRFDGVNDFLNGTTINNLSNSSLTIFVLANGKISTGSNVSVYFGINFYPHQFGLGRSSSNQSLIATNTSYYSEGLLSPINTLPNSGFPYNIFAYKKDLNITSKIFINGILQNSTVHPVQVGSFTNGNYYIGYGNPTNYLDFFNGDIVELILYDTLISENDRINIESYLMDKYAPPVNLGPDIFVNYGSCPINLGVSPNYNYILWSTGSTADTITVNQTGYYSVQVMDFAGRLSTDTVYVEFPHFGFQDAVVCLGDSIEYSSTMPGPYDYLWSDFSTDDHLFISQAGTYWLKLTDTLGCFITDTFVVAVDSFAVLASLGPDITLCSGDNIGLVSGDQPVNFLWSTTETSPTVIVQADGTYALTVTNINGCVAQDSISILIHGYKPTAGFLADSVCFGFPTGFTDTSSAVAPDAIALWQWTIQGNTISQQNPQYQFPAPGIHSVSLFVETDSGCTATVHQDIFVIPNPQPSFFPLTGCSGNPVQFTNQTTLEFGSIASWEWWATDSLGTIVDQSAATHPLFTFSEPGMYHLHLAAVTANGCRDTIVRPVDIRRSPPVDFIWSNVCIGQITAFNETTQVPAYEMIMQRSWNFGDNSTSTLTNPQHQYQATGTYNVSLFNRSINGCEHTITKQVAIHELPVAAFETSVPCLNTPVQFYNTSTADTGTIVSVMWTFPSGDSTSTWEPVYMFPDTGDYVIGLSVTTSEGCKSGSTQTVVVYPYPSAAFSFTPEYGVPPLEVSFINESTGASVYAWNFGDNSVSALANPQHTYTQTSVYTVELIAKNIFMCSDTTYGTVYVIPSTYDIAVTSAEQTSSGNLIQSHINIRNLGTRIVRNLQLKLQVDNGIAVTEQWSGTLLPGEDTWYTFSSLLDEDMLANRKVVCYSAMPDEDVEDNDLQNNTWCKVLEPGFYIMSVAPNPASTEIMISIVLSADGPYQFEMTSADGRRVTEQTELQGSRGLNKLLVDVSHLNQGLYIIKISDPYNSDLHRVLIAR